MRSERHLVVKYLRLTRSIHEEFREIPFDIIREETVLLRLQELIQRGRIGSVDIDLEGKNYLSTAVNMPVTDGRHSPQMAN